MTDPEGNVTRQGSEDRRTTALAAPAVVAWTVILMATATWAAAPKLTAVFPPGAARGQKVTITATGDFSKWPVEWRFDRPGLTATAAMEKGKVDVQVAPDAAPGVYWLRAIDAEGASSTRPFVVGTAREVEEVEPNDQVEKGQELELPVTVNAKVGKAGDVDGFVVKLKSGERLVAAVEGNGTLGSPMDAVLQVAEIFGAAAPVGGPAPRFARRPEAFVLEQRDDETGLDPRLSFVAPHDGRYLVRVFAFPSEPNASVALSGGDNYVYRLTLAAGPFVDFVLPLARSVAAAAGPFTIEEGNAAPGAEQRTAEITGAAADDAEFAAEDRATSWAFQSGAAGAFPLAWTNHVSLVATAEALTPAGQQLSLPATVSGRLVQPGQRATFRFSAAKGQKLRLKADARSLGFPLDALISIHDATGKTLAENDDASNQRDAALAFAAPADGVYSAAIRDVHGHGGARYAYRLTIEPQEPDFGLTVASDNFAILPGKTVEIPVTIDRRDGFAQEIELQVVGLPAGVTMTPAKSEAKGDSAKSVKLVLNADAAAAAANVSVRIVGVTAGQPLRRHRATYAVAGSPIPQRDLWLTVTKTP